MFVVLGSAAWLRRMLTGWSRRSQRLEAALTAGADELSKLEPTGPDLARKDQALVAIVEQIERLEAVPQNILSSIRGAFPQPTLVKDIAAFLGERVDLFREQAAGKGVTLDAERSIDRLSFL